MNRLVFFAAATFSVLWVAPRAHGAAASGRLIEVQTLTEARAVELLLTFRRTKMGVHVARLRDLKSNQQPLATNASPLFSVTLRHARTSPRISLENLGNNGFVLFPRGPGEAQRGVWRRAFQYNGNYSGAWYTMQFMAAYREGENPTGLYPGFHDSFGSTKDIELKSDPLMRIRRVTFDIPAPDMVRAGNNFAIEGEAVWQLLRGDWFDAAPIYKNWARREARWWPPLSKEGRADTPEWMRELSVWALSGGAPDDCVENVKRFREFAGVSAGFHWYNWRQIPFDNDYPHYFPAKTNFAQGVS